MTGWKCNFPCFGRGKLPVWRQGYHGVYGDDPSTDNPFGREELADRRSILLQEFLRRGGALSDFARVNGERQARIRLTKVLDRALNTGK